MPFSRNTPGRFIEYPHKVSLILRPGFPGFPGEPALSRPARALAAIHEMTALADMKSLRNVDRVFAATNELRTRGTDNLLAAAAEAGARRVIAQGYTGWPNERSGGPVKAEDDPLETRIVSSAARTLAAIRHVEKTVPLAAPEGIVLRYGSFYGPGASQVLLDFLRKRQLPVVGGGTGIWSFIEITDAAAATIAAVGRGAPGVRVFWLPAIEKAGFPA
jgi:2-alkyl-3-oxoalkanoate reductase